MCIRCLDSLAELSIFVWTSATNARKMSNVKLELCQSRVEIEANVRDDEKRIFAQQGRKGFLPSTSAAG